MADYRVVPASKKDLERWDTFVADSCNGTLFHRLAFLGYHGSRFSGKERHLVLKKGDESVALISCTVTEEAGTRIMRSPYGGSYGGFLLRRPPSYSESSAILNAFFAYVRLEGIGRICITPPLVCFSERPLDTFYFSMLEQGFQLINRDVSSVVGFSERTEVSEVVSSRARNMARKAMGAGVEIQHRAPLEDFYVPMGETFARHGVPPTHTREELADLVTRFPENVYFDVAYLAGKPVGGVCCFELTSQVITSFYLVQTVDGEEVQSLSLLVLKALERARSNGFTWFDFGTSTHAMTARQNIFRFKESFGACGMFRDTYEWSASC